MCFHMKKRCTILLKMYRSLSETDPETNPWRSRSQIKDDNCKKFDGICDSPIYDKNDIPPKIAKYFLGMCIPFEKFKHV